MNNVSLTGRITRDPELKTTPSGKNYILFNIAVDRGYKDAKGNRMSDFIPCVAWNSQADFIGKYIKKGNLIEITGSIQSRMYQNQAGGNRVLIEVILDSVSNLTPRPKEELPAPQEPSYYKPENDFTLETNVVNDEDLPF